MTQHRRFYLCLTAVLVGLSLAAMAYAGKGSFLNSDDYKDGKEVVKVFLQDEDYRLMVSDLERNGESLDWAWVKGAEGKGKARNLGFDLKSYKTISIPEIAMHHKGMIPGDYAAKVRDAFKQAVGQLGLEMVEGGDADLELAMALVDYKQDSTYAFVAMIKPFLELEMRLRDKKAGEDLMLVRHQAHGDNPEVAAFQFAELFLKFLQ